MMQRKGMGGKGIVIKLSTHIDNIVGMSMIYSLVARERLVLADYSSFSGNFSQVAL